MKKKNLQTKFPRRKIMDMYDISKPKILQLQKGGLRTYYFDRYNRKPYYDIKEFENLLKQKKEN